MRASDMSADFKSRRRVGDRSSMLDSCAITLSTMRALGETKGLTEVSWGVSWVIGWHSSWKGLTSGGHGWTTGPIREIVAQ